MFISHAPLSIEAKTSLGLQANENRHFITTARIQEYAETVKSERSVNGKTEIILFVSHELTHPSGGLLTSSDPLAYCEQETSNYSQYCCFPWLTKSELNPPLLP